MNILINPRVNGHLFLEDLIDRLDNDQPIVELFNVIYMTVSKTWKSSVLGLQMLTLKTLPTRFGDSSHNGHQKFKTNCSWAVYS